MNTKAKTIKTYAVWILMVTAGTTIMAFAFSVFLAPKNIVAGGFSGLALIMSNFLRTYLNVNISRGVIYFFLNVPIFIIAFRNLGKPFVLLSLWSMIVYSFCVDNIDFTLNVDDALLCSLYGGIIDGVGLGLVIRGNASTGGTDMIGNIVRKKNEKITIGTVIIAINVVVISLNVWYTKSLIVALYAFFSIFIEGLACDYISEGPRSIKAYYVISDKYKEIADHILHDLGRGVTCIETKGMYSMQEHEMLLCLISRRQVNELNRIVFSADPNAFVFSTDCKDAIGNGFAKPKKPQKTSDLYRLFNGEAVNRKTTATPMKKPENASTNTATEAKTEPTAIPKDVE